MTMQSQMTNLRLNTAEYMKMSFTSSIGPKVRKASFAALEKAAPEARLFTATVDDGLNEVAYIVPGLGDACDRQFGPR